MTSHAVRRSALAASAAALTLLVTACGGSSDDGKKDEGKAKADPAASAAPAAKALTAAELEKAALTQADLKSGKVTDKIAADEDATKDKVKADDAACLPVAFAQSGVAQADPSAAVKRQWTREPEKPSGDLSDEEMLLASMAVDQAFVTLSSYEGGAEQPLKDLAAAAEKCAGGFTTTMLGEKIKVGKVAVTEAPAGGDEGLALTLTVEADEDVKMPQKIVVIRKGATLASFTAVNFASAATGEDFPFPAELVDAQLPKLG
ncbi:hypothetical protein [Streptomyces tagetis]|uniref:Lipoprotein n=1 Tax=Streptomyces tagetis TaxID=2820809 RepID=A0A941AZE5_9ACTN|nr:hypothetical protein [Streptomyces sp. RG38]MBQ0828669.1 hypothetical protein [Streptomyces sp. RG38]